MNISRTTKSWMGIVLTALVLLGLAASALAQTGGDFGLTWSSVDGGGYTFSVGGGYELGGTAGQSDAGAMAGGDFGLAGGFWYRRAYQIYLPLLVRGSR